MMLCTSSSFTSLNTPFRGSSRDLHACTVCDAAMLFQPQLPPAALQQHSMAGPGRLWRGKNRKSDAVKHDNENLCIQKQPPCGKLRVGHSMHKQRPPVAQAAAQQLIHTQHLPVQHFHLPKDSAFRPCLDMVHNGNVQGALKLLEQVISRHGSPDRKEGDAILLVSTAHSRQQLLHHFYTPLSSCAVAPKPIPAASISLEQSLQRTAFGLAVHSLLDRRLFLQQVMLLWSHALHTLCMLNLFCQISRLSLMCPQGIANPGKAGRVGPALGCLQILPSEKGHYYYKLIRHYCSKGNCPALASIQSALAADDRWNIFQQDPSAAW